MADGLWAGRDLVRGVWSKEQQGHYFLEEVGKMVETVDAWEADHVYAWHCTIGRPLGAKTGCRLRELSMIS